MSRVATGTPGLLDMDQDTTQSQGTPGLLDMDQDTTQSLGTCGGSELMIKLGLYGV